MDVNVPWRRAAVLAVTPLLLAACGKSDKSSGGGDSSSPAGRISAVSKAIAKVKTLHIEGTQTDKDGPATLEGDIAAKGDVQLSVKQGSSQFTLLRVSKTTYLKANTAYWTRESNPRVGQVLGGKWVKAPASSVKDIDKQVATLLPAGLSRCIKSDLGTLQSAGTADVDGKQSDVIEDLGDKPGTEPGKLYIAKDGPPLPVRVVQTGPRKDGAPRDSFCDDPESTQTSEDVRLTYNEPVSLKAPPNAIDLDALHSGNGGSGLGQAA